MRTITTICRSALGALAALALVAAPLTARAGEGHGPGRHGGPEQRLEQNLEELGLSDAQLTKVRGVIASAREQRAAQREQMRIEFDAMHDLLEAEAPDEAAVMRQADKIGAMKTEAHKAMLHTLLAVRAELTPEQREKLGARMREHGPRRGLGFHGHGGGCGHGKRGGSAEAPPEGGSPEP